MSDDVKQEVLVSTNWVADHLACPRVRNYDGSWTEYGSLVGVPIER